MKKKILPALLYIIVITISSCSKDDDSNLPCPSHYTGTNCDEQITPSKITITEVKVIEYLCNDNGNDWDFDGSGADIKISIEKGAQTLYSSTYISDCSCVATSYTYPCSVDAIANDVLTFRLYDDDSPLADDYIGGISSKLYNSTGGFPATKILDAGAGVRLEVKLSYTW
jgi:hypothetical protein